MTTTTRKARIPQRHTFNQQRNLLQAQLDQALRLDNSLEDFFFAVHDRFAETLQTYIERTRAALAALPAEAPQAKPVFPLKDEYKRHIAGDEQSLIQDIENLNHQYFMSPVLDSEGQWWKPRVVLEWEVEEHPPKADGGYVSNED